MLIGVPKEIKNHEYRVALTPAGVRELIAQGHEVIVESGAGEGSGYPDAEYQGVGARLESDVERVFRDAELFPLLWDLLPWPLPLLPPGPMPMGRPARPFTPLLRASDCVEGVDMDGAGLFLDDELFLDALPLFFDAPLLFLDRSAG